LFPCNNSRFLKRKELLFISMGISKKTSGGGGLLTGMHKYTRVLSFETREKSRPTNGEISEHVS